MCNNNERIDDLEINGYQLIQKVDGFCFGIDAVILAAWANAHKKDKVLDLCSGSGVIPILMEAHGKGCEFTALEIQEVYANLISRNVELNNISTKFKIINGDLKDHRKLLEPCYYNVVTVNPPYMGAETGYKNESEEKFIARHEVKCNVNDVVAAAAWALDNRGHFYMIHRPDRLTDIICAMRSVSLEPKRLRMVEPMAGKAPTMVMIEGMKNAAPGIKVEPPLTVYKDVNVYTDEVLRMYNKI